MIISRTPYRVSLAGGGTDVPAFFRERSSLIVSAALNRHFYVSLTSRLDDRVRLSYTRTETVANAEDLRHDIARTILLRYGLRTGLEIGMIGEVPGGTGLGSSSAVAVGLLHAVRRRLRLPCAAATLAEEAIQVETELLRHGTGWQDPYGVAFPALKAMTFERSTAQVTFIDLSAENRKALETNSMLVYTGRSRRSGPLMFELVSRMDRNLAHLEEIVHLAREARTVLEADRVDLARLGALLDESWRIKRAFGAEVTNPAIDALYDAGKAAGAWGGKLLGAGGGGFLFFLIPAARQEAMLERMGRQPAMLLTLDSTGSTIVHDRAGERGDDALFRWVRRPKAPPPPPPPPPPRARAAAGRYNAGLPGGDA